MNTQINFERKSATTIYRAGSGAIGNTLTRPLTQPCSGAYALCNTARRLAQSARQGAANFFLTASNHKGELMQYLATSRPGRVTLHALCLVRRPDRFVWHWHGILREFAV